MRSFDSLDQIRSASVEELSEVDGITPACAEAVYAYFHREKAVPFPEEK